MKLLEIKPLTTVLLPAALELDRRCFGGLWTQDGYERELSSPNSDLLVLQEGQGGYKTGQQTSDKAVSSTAPSSLASSPTPLLGMGCLWAILEEAHITTLAIHPDYQRQGLGQALLYALLVSAWRRGQEWATLEVRVSNQTAIALYKKFGFQDVGKRRRYYQDNGEDALILWRSGLQKPEFQQTLQIWQNQVSDRLNQAGWQLNDDFLNFPLDERTLSS